MRTKKDVEKIADSLSPEIAPALLPFAARSQKPMSVSVDQEAQTMTDIVTESKS